MAVNEEDFNCKNCGQPLEWVDTVDTEGGINEGYIIEHQAWTCPNCQKDYAITQQANFNESDVDITEITEA